MAKNIKKRSDDYAQWYLDVIKAARLVNELYGSKSIEFLYGPDPVRTVGIVSGGFTQITDPLAEQLGLGAQRAAGAGCVVAVPVRSRITSR